MWVHGSRWERGGRENLVHGRAHRLHNLWGECIEPNHPGVEWRKEDVGVQNKQDLRAK